MNAFVHTDTNLPPESDYPKLVRDNIPQIIKQANGVDVPTRVLDDDAEFDSYLAKKTVEEAVELSDTLTPEHILEETADVLEVMETRLALHSLTLEQVRDVQAQKRQKRGGFTERILMISDK